VPSSATSRWRGLPTASTASCDLATGYSCSADHGTELRRDRPRHDSLQLTDSHKVATPVNWKQGEDVIIVPAVSDDEARTKFPRGWKAVTAYRRLTLQPK